MNPYRLYKRVPFLWLFTKTVPVNRWVCSECHRATPSEEEAINCCTCRGCGEAVTDEEDRKHHYSRWHRRCWWEEQAEREAKRLAAAAEVTDYDSMVFTDRGWGQDGWFQSVEHAVESLFDMFECWDAMAKDWPAFMFCATPIPFKGLDWDDALDSLAEDMFEEARDQFVGVEELRTAFDAFNKANEGCICFEPDYKRKVAIPEPQVLRMYRRLSHLLHTKRCTADEFEAQVEKLNEIDASIIEHTE